MIYKKFGVIYGVVLTAFTAYVLLDTFVIPTKYSSASTSQPITGYSQSLDATDETDITLPSLQEESSSAENYAESTPSIQNTEEDNSQESTQQKTEITDT